MIHNNKTCVFLFVVIRANVTYRSFSFKLWVSATDVHSLLGARGRGGGLVDCW